MMGPAEDEVTVGRRRGHMKRTEIEQPLREELPTDGEATHSPDGVDLTLIRWMLSLTPEERLEVLRANVGSILRLRGEETEA